ncbi:MAG TPA: cell surface protein, partial [Opitutae bacterium]|nr:cell surface protein [Opitutae bacterium]
MDTFESKTNKRNWLISLIAPLALFMAGCNVSVIDLTPSTIKSNPSNVYTITAQIRIKNSAVVAQSLRPQIVIDGQVHPMTLAPGSDILFEYDYRMPVGRTEAAYYMLVQYDRITEDGVAAREIVSELSRFIVENRYSVELEVNRAPVGSRVAVLGRGFSRDDKILVGDIPAATRFDSSTSLSFYVPSLPEGRGYEVKV